MRTYTQDPTRTTRNCTHTTHSSLSHIHTQRHTWITTHAQKGEENGRENGPAHAPAMLPRLLG